MASAIEYKTLDQMRRIREVALIVDDIHATLRENVCPGMTTAEADVIAHEVLVKAGARSNFLGYYDYPANICTSVNEVIVHGIPDERVMNAGDIVSFDCGAVKDGWHGDSCFTMVMPSDDPQLADVIAARERLSHVTEQSMWAGIAAMAYGKRVGDIGAAIDDYVTSVAPDLDIVLDYTGHGIGTAMHQEPDVLNFRARGRTPRLKPGMVLCIEPMLVRGRQDNHVLSDDWTVVTNDGTDACHWECQVALHEGGIWVLNRRDGGARELEPFGVTPVPL
ncbi:MAG: type I methionyl aminopeptidase [Actinomycetaceae bacterium]|nr:type I methionyl aminopeptidase [Actinomycetaceae bacterium]